MSLVLGLSTVILLAVVLLLGFLLLGVLRSVERLGWRMDQLEAVTPSRVGRSGLRPGIKAPDFTLPCASGGEISLHDYAGRRILLVFTQTGCGPCRAIVPELNRLDRSEIQVLAVNRGSIDETRQWAAEAAACFPVVAVEGLELARRYEIFATPFAFLVNGRGVIVSKGIVGNPRHVAFLLSDADQGQGTEEAPAEESALAAVQDT